jgi:hypothetical protein
MAVFVRDLDVHEFGSFMGIEDISRTQQSEIYEAASSKIIEISERQRFMQRNIFDFLMQTEDGRLVELHTRRAYEYQED